MSVQDMARRCMRCSLAAGTAVEHFPGEPHLSRWRLWWLRLRRR